MLVYIYYIYTCLYRGIYKNIYLYYIWTYINNNPYVCMTACVHTYGSILVPVYLYIYIPLMYPLCTRNCVCRTRGGHKWPCTRGPEDRQALIRFIFVSLCRSSVSFFLFQYSSLCPSSFSSLVTPPRAVFLFSASPKSNNHCEISSPFRTSILRRL